MTNERFANVWDAIEDTPAEAENMKVRSSLMLALQQRIETSGMIHGEAASLYGVTRPRMSDLMHGKISLFGIDALINMLASAGLHVEVQIAEAA